MKKICLLGGYAFENYGDEITYYSLYKRLTCAGYTVKMLSWPEKYKRYYKAYQYPIKMWDPQKEPCLFESNPYGDDLLNIVKNRSELERYNEQFDIFMVGSGQYFNARVLNNIRYYTLLDWVQKKKIAYSAAWGNGDYVTKDTHERELIYSCIKRFDHFSVREEQSVKIAKEEFGIEAQQVIDPVFLCDKKWFYDIAQEPDRSISEEFIFSYMLDSSEINGRYIKEFSERNNLNVISVCAESMHVKSMCKKHWPLLIEQNVCVENWVWYIQNCKFMVTDSFHGMCMAIVFNKPFVVITRPLAGNDRYSSLLGRLGLLNHILDNPVDLSNTSLSYWNIDFSTVNNTIDLFVKSSNEWLNNAIGTQKYDESKNRSLLLDADFIDCIKYSLVRVWYGLSNGYIFDILRRIKHLLKEDKL